MQHLKSKIAAIGTGAAAIALIAGAALAAAPYDISVGGSDAAGPHDFTATTGTSPTAVTLTANDPGTGLVVMHCTESDASGSVTSGPSVDNPIGSITSISFGGCTAPGGPVTVSMTNSPWTVNGTGTPSGGSVAGNVGDIKAHVENTALAATCSFDVTGSANGTFDSPDQQLNIDDETFVNLTLSNVSGCLGQLNSGDGASFVATYDVTVDGGDLSVG